MGNPPPLQLLRGVAAGRRRARRRRAAARVGVRRVGRGGDRDRGGRLARVGRRRAAAAARARTPGVGLARRDRRGRAVVARRRVGVHQHVVAGGRRGPRVGVGPASVLVDARHARRRRGRTRAGRLARVVGAGEIEHAARRGRRLVGHRRRGAGVGVGRLLLHAARLAGVDRRLGVADRDLAALGLGQRGGRARRRGGDLRRVRRVTRARGRHRQGRGEDEGSEEPHSDDGPLHACLLLLGRGKAVFHAAVLTQYYLHYVKMLIYARLWIKICQGL